MWILWFIDTFYYSCGSKWRINLLQWKIPSHYKCLCSRKPLHFRHIQNQMSIVQSVLEIAAFLKTVLSNSSLLPISWRHEVLQAAHYINHFCTIFHRRNIVHKINEWTFNGFGVLICCSMKNFEYNYGDCLCQKDHKLTLQIMIDVLNCQKIALSLIGVKVKRLLKVSWKAYKKTALVIFIIWVFITYRRYFTFDNFLHFKDSSSCF